jgi:hypothetical protein
MLMPVPTFALANVKVGVPVRETTSGEITPTKEAVPVAVAAVVRLYTLFAPVRPVTVKVAAVIFLDVKLGWINV